MVLEDIIVKIELVKEMFSKRAREVHRDLFNMREGLDRIRQRSTIFSQKQIEGISRTKKEFVRLNSTMADSEFLAHNNKVALKSLFTGVVTQADRFVDSLKMSNEELKKFHEQGGMFSQKQLDGMSKTKKDMNNLNKNFDDLSDLGRENKLALNDLFTGITPQTAKFGDVLSMTHKEFSDFNKQGRQFQGTGARVANKIRMMTSGLKGFRMEMLGIMFFGMAMQNMFFGFLRPAGEMLGIFELWNLALGVLFLPIMIEILPLILDLINYMIDLPDPVKKALGAFVLFGGIIGGFLFVVGTMALGLGSLFSAGVTGLIGMFLYFIVIFGGIILIISGFQSATDNKMKAVGLVLLGFGLILTLFIGWWALIPVAVGAAILLIENKWIRIKLFFKNLWIDIKMLFFKGVKELASVLVDLPIIGSLFTTDKADKALADLEFEKRVNTGQAIIDGLKKTDKESNNLIDTIVNTFKSGQEDMTKEVEEGSNNREDSVRLSSFNIEAILQQSMNDNVQTFSQGITEMNGVVDTKLADLNLTFIDNFDNISTSFDSFVGNTRTNAQKIADIMSRIPGGGSAFGGGPSFNGGGSVGSGTKEDPYRADTTSVNDFLVRPGQSTLKINPNDTVMGVKDVNKLGGSGVTINQYNTVSGSLMSEVERMIKEANSRLVDDVKRLTGA